MPVLNSSHFRSLRTTRLSFDVSATTVQPARLTPAANTRITPLSLHLHGQTRKLSRMLSLSKAPKMSSDEDYLAFLEKANKDPNEGYDQSASASHAKKEFKTTDQGVTVPKVLLDAVRNKFYTSEADEPFKAVALKWDENGKGLPDEEELATLIHHPNPSGADIQIMDPTDWDSQGQYRDLLEAVEEAGKGNDVRVYRIVKDSTRLEYWVLTTQGSGKSAKLVGVKALSIES